MRNIAVERLNVAMDNWVRHTPSLSVRIADGQANAIVCTDGQKKTKQPFFVGMGTHRPHLGWEFPIEYEIPTPVEAVPEAAHKYWPHEVPHLHYHECAEMAATYLDDTGFGRPFANQTGRSEFTNHQAELRRACAPFAPLLPCARCACQLLLQKPALSLSSCLLPSTLSV